MKDDKVQAENGSVHHDANCATGDFTNEITGAISQELSGTLPPLPRHELVTHVPDGGHPFVKVVPNVACSLDSLAGRELGSTLLLRELGRGGMGAVFEGFQSALGRKVAVKVLLPELVQDDMAVGRFRREAMAIAKLRSPHVVQIFDTGVTSDNVLYIVMEYLDGQTLAALLKQRGRLDVGEALYLMLQAAQGLQAAHQAGLVHRDIKPSNLMFNKQDLLCLTDFGLARTYQSGESFIQSITRNQAVMGTPAYMSPEQIKMQTLDGRSDIYSLGIVLFELLVGQLPFQSDDCMQLLVEHLQKPCPDPREFYPSIPAPVAELLRLMVAKEPNDRISDSATLCQVLIDILQGLPGARNRWAESHQRNTPAYGVAWKRITTPSSSSLPSTSSQKPALGSSPSLVEKEATMELDNAVLATRILKLTKDELAVHIGPIAGVLLKQEIRNMGLSRHQFPLHQLDGLSSRLASHINEEQRSVFLTKVRSFVRSAQQSEEEAVPSRSQEASHQSDSPSTQMRDTISGQPTIILED